MAVTLRELLLLYRTLSSSEREKGGYFERLVRVWLENAPTQKDQFTRVVTYPDFAKERGWNANDTGIDLMAQIAGEDDAWCAIQCKFYAEDYKIQKVDIDSFFTASGKTPITRRLIVDSTSTEWGKNAKEAIFGQSIPCTRIGLNEIEYSGIDWGQYSNSNGETVRLLDKKTPRTHQLEALEATQIGLTQADRGKLIMACGTGKTYTGLIIAQSLAGKGGRVLFLVPSLSLMSQTIREWAIDATIPLRSYAVCSDVQVGVNKAKDDDLTDIDITDLEIPATTSAWGLAKAAGANESDRMTVVFSTYQSLPAVAKAQLEHGLPAFDLIICDEAHRTTGATLVGKEESNFVRVHDAAYIQGKKRVYMTATPRVFGEAIKKKAGDADAALISMDDEALYGQTLFTRNFGWAVENGLLTDYKVIVLAMDEEIVTTAVQNRIKESDNKLKLDDATKMVGCYKALTKIDLRHDIGEDVSPVRRALAFARSIEASETFAKEFPLVSAEWRASLELNRQTEMPPLSPKVLHVDGKFSANARNERLAWLKAKDVDEDACRILSNAKCLSEGVDVPALDAIMFLHPRKSQIDVVQSVGRVMRRAPGKKMGYVILPVVIPSGMTPEQALDKDETFQVVWQVLNALRSHDERLDSTINKIGLGVDAGGRIEIIAEAKNLPSPEKPKKGKLGLGDGAATGDDDDSGAPSVPREPEPEQTAFVFDEFSKAIMAKIVKKCGTRTYWEDWAKDVARIAQVHITRIKAVVEVAGSVEANEFEKFLAEIRDDLNDAISSDEAIEMLAQHLITRPVFDALFEGYAFAEQNPVSRALEAILNVLDHQHLEKETKTLERFYNSVRTRAAGIEDAGAKQKIVVELYEKFFKSAFPKLTQRMGIVYTPIEIVDFIIKSVEEVLNEEFGQSISDEGVHVIDPFTGTGTFITRLLQSALIKPEDMTRKFREEIHANEIVLLAYYIAAINIEAAFHDQTGTYEPFPGICLTDTFQMYEKKDMISALMEANSARRKRQRDQPITVIIGNPPYSAGQNSANDNAANVDYPGLDARIGETYAARGTATNKNALYDSYIRAIRWGSDRLAPHGGVLAFVTNAGWIDANTADGLRKSLADEFTRIDVFHLRGNQRTQGEQSRREGGKIFGQGSRTPVAITLLTLNPSKDTRGRIRVHDIGDYLSREEKLVRVAQFASLSGIAAVDGWQTVKPDEHGDWLNQRAGDFGNFAAIGDKSGQDKLKIFESHSLGVQTKRDAWAINPSKDALLETMRSMIDVYNGERDRFVGSGIQFQSNQARTSFVDGFVISDPSKISWSENLKADLARGKALAFDSSKAVPISYRPFTRQWLYFDRRFNDRVFQMPKFFPDIESSNKVIVITGSGESVPFSCFAISNVSELKTLYNSQCFPRYIYTPAPQTLSSDGPQKELFAAEKADPDAPKYIRTDAITDAGLQHFTDAYPGHPITKDDIFDYVYGILHHPTYRERYADNLTKQLPRIPLMKTAAAFATVVAAGKALGDLHINYESVEPWPVTIAQGDLALANIPDPIAYWRVEKMKFGGKRPNLDKTTIHYNPRVTISGIPLRSYDYVVNGKSAIDWVMERQCVKTDQASGIVSDANAYANETIGDPRYPFDLLCRVITVSMRTLDIIETLPPFDVLEG